MQLIAELYKCLLPEFSAFLSKQMKHILVILHPNFAKNHHLQCFWDVFSVHFFFTWQCISSNSPCLFSDLHWEVWSFNSNYYFMSHIRIDQGWNPDPIQINGSFFSYLSGVSILLQVITALKSEARSYKVTDEVPIVVNGIWSHVCR